MHILVVLAAAFVFAYLLSNMNSHKNDRHKDD